MKENKVMILCLGKGRSFYNRDAAVEQQHKEGVIAESEYIKIDKLFEKNSPVKKDIYQATNYTLSGVTYRDKSFVADPIIHSFKPDHVIVFGSVTSAWSSFYKEFAKNPSKDSYIELYKYENLQKFYGIETCGEELDRIERRINQIFRDSGPLRVTTNEEEVLCDVRIILIRYGLDQDQLMENYRRFQAVRDVLQKKYTGEDGKEVDVRNIVSFDITFSFRSLPIYNLVVLNFLENISDYNIEIRNVYYGCVEAKEEYRDDYNEPAAPIVDLNQIIHILKLTNGASEFGNTGNAVTLIRTVDNPEDPFIQALKEFDWATQTNDFEGIEKALARLAKWDKEETFHPASSGSISAIRSDYIGMVLTVIKTKLFEQPAVRIARDAVQGTSVRVGLSAGPLTVMMEPYGDLEEDEAAEIYNEIFRAGIKEGADLIQLETFIDLNMLCVAAREAKKYGVPVLCTMSFEESGRTIFGNSVENMAEELGAIGVDGVGLNCSLGPDKAAPIMKKFAEVTNLPLICKPNAGLPVMDSDGNMVNPYTKENFADEIADVVSLLSYVGGCCGTDPSYISLLKERFRSHPGN